jgi:RimJ/RimL family protein N-acetyltransferase
MFARTERLLLRPGWGEDAIPLAAAIGDEAILTKLARAPSPYTLGDAQYFLSMPRGEDHADFLIFMRTQGAPRLVGGVGVIPDQERGALELGYWVARPYWGLGIATEAAHAVIGIARNTLQQKRLVSAYFHDNPASGHVLRKLGFRPTGETVLRRSEARGHDVPCHLLELDLDEEPAMPRVELEMPRLLAA